MKFNFFLVVFLIISGFNFSCKSIVDVPKLEQKRNEFTSAYICPMNCKGSGSAVAGKCPKCELEYVKNKKYK